MKLYKMNLLCAGMVALMLGMPLQAALIGVTDHGSYFSDTTSGFDWLDVNASINRSYNDINAQFGANGDFEGYRFATATEFSRMIDNISGVPGTAPTGYSSVHVTIDGLVEEIIALMGGNMATQGYAIMTGNEYCDDFPSVCVNGLPYAGGIAGYLMAEQGETFTHVAGVSYDDLGFNQDTVSTNVGAWNFILPRPTVGSFLVRETVLSNGNSNTVPEPSALWLISLGMIGLIGMSKKSTKASQLSA